MQSYVMLTRLAPGSIESPVELEQPEKAVARQIRADCPHVEWVASYAVFGPYDYVDVFHAPDLDTAAKVSAIVRSYGHAQTEIWAAQEWDHFKEVICGLSRARDDLEPAPD
jgi:uncharacterized protein with GYD domain